MATDEVSTPDGDRPADSEPADTASPGTEEAGERPEQEEPEVITPTSSISEPAKLTRLAAMVRAMLNEVRRMNLDEPGLRRMQSFHNHTVDELRELLSEDLQQELDEVVLPLGAEPATEGEIRVAQAQLAGWLEGLFHGIRASMRGQALVVIEQDLIKQLEEMKETEDEDKPGPGQYL